MFIESMMPSNHFILFLLTSMSQHQGLFPVSWLFALGGQNIAASTSASVLPVNIQGWFPLGWTDLISLLSKELSRVFSSTTVQKHQFFGTHPFLWSNPDILYMTTGKTIALTRCTFVGKVMSLLFNMLSRFVTAFLSSSRCLFISWLQSPSAVILEPKKIKSVTVSTFSPSICYEVMTPDAMVLIFKCWFLSQLFHCLLSPSSRGSLVSLHFLPLGSCPGKNTGVGCHFLLQGIFPTQGLKPGRSPSLQVTFYCLSHHGSPNIYFLIT